MGKKNKKKEFFKKRKICLNMIVKDEAHIIEETIESVVPYIDYWVICDTGSTDGTQELILKTFKKHGIPGDLHQHKWRDFGYNRTLALREAYDKAQFIWVMDADDLVKGDLVWPEKMTADCYNLQYGSPALRYQRMQVFKASLNWRYECVLHEHASCISKPKPKAELLQGNYYIDSRRLGNRSKNPNKYLDDAKVLVDAHNREKDDPKGNKKHMVRYSFYAGQSYFDFKDYENAIVWYQKRVDYGGWREEVYYSLFRIALSLQRLEKPIDVVKDAFLKAHNYLPSRATPLFHLSMEYRKYNDFKTAYKYAKMGEPIPYPKDQVLFLSKSVYDWQMKNEVAVCAFMLGEYGECLEMCEKMMAGHGKEYEMPEEVVMRVRNTMFECTRRMNNPQLNNTNTGNDSTIQTDNSGNSGTVMEKEKDAGKTGSFSRGDVIMEKYKIGLLVPSTTNKTDKQIENMTLLTTFLPSLIASINPRRRDEYVLYLGYDIGDEVYDNKEQMKVVSDKIRALVIGKPITVKCYRMNNDKKSVVSLWNRLYKLAYDEGCDYFYQLGDDIRFEPVAWAEPFITKLKEYGDVGVVGPQDRVEIYRRIMTQSFVSRKHYEIFGYYYPDVFKNWFSDNWITDVYDLDRSFVFQNIGIRNCLAGGFKQQRYEIDYNAQHILKEEVHKGKVKLLEYLK